MSDSDEKQDALLNSLIAPGEADTVRKLVEREIENVKRGLDLEYKIKAFLDMRERRRWLLLEASELERRMKRLEIPPGILKNL